MSIFILATRLYLAPQRQVEGQDHKIDSLFLEVVALNCNHTSSRTEIVSVTTSLPTTPWRIVEATRKLVAFNSSLVLWAKDTNFTLTIQAFALPVV